MLQDLLYKFWYRYRENEFPFPIWELYVPYIICYLLCKFVAIAQFIMPESSAPFYGIFKHIHQYTKIVSYH